MTREDLIKAIAQEEDISEEEVEAVVDQLLSLVKNRMGDQDETSFYGFGKFGVRWWKGRTGRDPQTGEEIEIEGRWMPYWTPSDTLIEAGEPHPKDSAAADESEKTVVRPVEQTKEDSEEILESEKHEESPVENIETASAHDFPETSEATASAIPESQEPDEPADSPEPAISHQSRETQFRPSYTPYRPASSSRKWFIVLSAIVIVVVLGFIGFGFLGNHQTNVTDVPAKEPATQPNRMASESVANAPKNELSSTKTPAKSSTSTSDNKTDTHEETPVSQPPAPNEISHTQEQFFENYKTALNQFRDRNYRAAKQMFQQMAQENPPIDYADNVYYWLGESEFALGEYEDAVTSFGRVFQYPNTNKMDDAILMMAYSYRKMGEYNQARLLLLRFRHQYSDSPYARLAENWLQNDSLNHGKSH